jgi:hypothetical protein
VSFEQRDLDETIPLADSSVSFAVANFGAASELRPDLLNELQRLLKAGGKALLSYYNKDALVNHWIYPWPATIHSHLNPYGSRTVAGDGGYGWASLWTVAPRQ